MFGSGLSRLGFGHLNIRYCFGFRASNLEFQVEWFPTLRKATDKQRNSWRLIGKGVGIHWEELDEDLSVGGLLRY